LILNLGNLQDAVDERMAAWVSQQFARKLWNKETSLWHPDPQPEIIDRLGWLALPEGMQEKCEDLLSFAHQVKKDGFSHILLLGMGGSSLAPEVYQKVMGNAPGFPELIVLDSTHPAAIRAVEKKLPTASTLVIVSSKSGTTLETSSLFQYFWKWASSNQSDPGRFFVAITDEKSPLESVAKKHRFRRIFLPPSDVGGRYAAFTEFGLVPAALIGIDIQRLLSQGQAALREDLSPGKETNSSGLALGAALGELARQKNKLTLRTTRSLAGFPSWLEQLLAESLGKKGQGIVPVVEEPVVREEIYGQDRAFVGFFSEEDSDPSLEKHFDGLDASGHPNIRINLHDRYEIGRDVIRWEIATASAGSALGIHPFNQPDVQLTKDLTRKAMEKSELEKTPGAKSALGFSFDGGHADLSVIENFLSSAHPEDYLALQAYLPPLPEIKLALLDIRSALFQRTRLATTLGFGPRFLHSTGQLHKGGPDTVVAIQIVDEPNQEIPVPGTNYTFGDLIAAQAWGDYNALTQKKRRAIRINLGGNIIESLKKLEKFFY
jgi:transaldolase/glucose-6-phosphate isomerase